MIKIETEYPNMVENFLYTKEELESFSTEKLVGFIHFARFSRHDDYYIAPDFADYYHKGIIQVEADWIGDNTLNHYNWAVEEELREILKTRPNIPNKQQKKKMLKDTISENRKNVKKNLKYKR